MAGEVKSRSVAKKYISFWRKSLFISLFLAITISGCYNPPFGDFHPNTTPEQKKIELQRSLNRKYNDPRAHFLLGQLYHADRALDDAQFHYEEALRFGPFYQPAQAAMLRLLIDRGDKVGAEDDYQDYLNLAGDSPDNILALARELDKQKVDDFALRCFEQAREIAPNSDKVHPLIYL